LAAALAESAFAGGLGMDLDIRPLGLSSNVVALFSESQSRLVATVRPEDAAAFEAAMSGSACCRLGEVTAAPNLVITGQGGAKIDVPLAELKEAWQRPLRW
jgi:phosphoribosylformylglycinamidine synthase